MNYYNEWDKGAAAWLRELIKQGHIPYGYVDERSIADVTPSDLEGFTQCHFFAGIGGWSQALHLARVRPEQRLWTGSPPCQPFSVAGKQLGQLDERHLAPIFMRLVEQCRPPILFGEQVAAAIGKYWLDDLFTEVERQGYACGSAVLPACSVGAPHKRDRLFFGAVNQMAYTDSRGFHGERESYGCFKQDIGKESQSVSITRLCENDELAYADVKQRHGSRDIRSTGRDEPANNYIDNPANPDNGFWSGADWLGCRDGKFRPVKSGTFPLANGIPARVGRLRGYGNAIVPQVAAEFIKAFMGSVEQ